MGEGSAVPAPHACRVAADVIRPLQAAHDAVHTGEPAPAATRPAIRESWLRSREAGADPGVREAPLVFDSDMIEDARSAHPLHSYLPMLRGLLRWVGDESEHMMVITDAEGHALWCEGPRPGAPGGRRVGLVAGHCWSEGSVGTNGIGTALAVQRPQYVYSAEHLARSLHQWSCAGAPIMDPDSGLVLGCIDVSATVRAVHPAAVALVGAAAGLAQAQLALDMHARDERLRERYLRQLYRLRGPGALLTATGRVLAATPAGWCGVRLPVPEPGGVIVLPDGRPAVAEALGEALVAGPAGGAAAGQAVPARMRGRRRLPHRAADAGRR
jgi:transcriptional regulator of acetoin/glycerol metabolism